MIHPGIPHFVERRVVGDVSEENLSKQHLGFIAAGILQQRVDLGENLNGLTFDIGRTVDGHLTRKNNPVAMHHAFAHTSAGAKPLDRHI